MGHYPLPWWAVELQESGSGSSAACPVGSETEGKASTGAPKGRCGLPMACCPSLTLTAVLWVRILPRASDL